MHPAKLFTDEAFKDHTAFWRTALERAAGDFHFRQPSLSYAPDSAASVAEEVPLTERSGKRPQHAGLAYF